MRYNCINNQDEIIIQDQPHRLTLSGDYRDDVVLDEVTVVVNDEVSQPIVVTPSPG